MVSVHLICIPFLSLFYKQGFLMVRRMIPALLAALGGFAAFDLAHAQSPSRGPAPAASNLPASNPRKGHASDELALRIDLRFEELWKDIGVEQKEVVDDATYLRRVYLDLVGTIPSVAQTRDFLNDETPEKRRKL